MRNTKKATGTVHVVERRPSSQNGNPRWLVRFEPADGSDPVYALTLPDAAVAYGIQNPGNAAYPAEWYIGTYRGRTHISDCA